MMWQGWLKTQFRCAVRQRVGIREKGIGASKVPRPVYRSENTSRLLANILHYVNFAAERPANRRDIAAEQPQTRPEPLTVRDFDAGLEHQVALAILIDILIVRIVLQLRIPPAVTTNIRAPLALIGGSSRRPIKLVTPDKLPGRSLIFGRCCCSCTRRVL